MAGSTQQPQQHFIYIVEKPDSDLHEEDTSIYASTREEADKIAADRATSWECKLRFVGWRVAGKYVFDRDAVLPAWAQEVA